MRWGYAHSLVVKKLWTVGTRPIQTQACSLRPYQQSCLDACLDALAQGCSKIGVSLPTGAGKTVVFASLLSRIAPRTDSPLATRSLIIVNSVELARQAAAQVKKLYPRWSVEIEQGSRNKASGLADITVATYQTLLQAERLAKFHPDGLKVVVVDEAHHVASPSYRFILSHFDSSIKNPKLDKGVVPGNCRVPIIGFSATFSRHDGLALGAVFDRIVYHRDFLEMIKEQWLCNVRFTCVRANLNLKDVTINSRTGDYNPTSLAQVVNTPIVNKLVVQTWLDRAASRKSSLMFCVNLTHVRELTHVFREAGVDARYVSSRTPAAEREALISSFKSGKFPVLVNCAILTEGADIPNIDCVVVARPTRSRNVLAQMIGRGMRLSPETGKEDCHVIDFIDIGSRSPGLVSTPTLFGLDPAEVIDGESIESLERRGQEEEEASDYTPEEAFDTADNIPDPTSVTYVDYDNPFAFVGGSSGAPHVAKLSPNAWVGCGGDVYVLECLGKGHIRIEPVEDEDSDDGVYFQAHYTPPAFDKFTARVLKLSPFQRNRKILIAEDLSNAIRGADTYANTKVLKGPLVVGLRRSAKWRRQPASEQQKKFIEIRWSKSSKSLSATEESTPNKLSNLSKGEAANIITRIKHGALSRYQSRLKVERKEKQKQLKEDRRRAREIVEVGPLTNN